MKKIIRDVDEKRGIVQVTIADERWYLKQVKNAEGMPEIRPVPSSTWIASFYPKGLQYMKWLAEHGWDEAEALKNAAGDKGTKVHLAIEDIFQGKEVRIDSKYINKSTEKEEELTLEEVECIMSFLAWKKEMEKEYTIENIAWETTVFSEKYNYAGTIDWIVKLTHKETKEVEHWIIDFKTSQQVWPSHELQISSYKRTVENAENQIPNLKDVSNLRIGILQVGYKKNKNKYKFTEITDQFDLFLAAQKIWKKETEGADIIKRDIPIVLSPGLKVEDVKFEKVEVSLEEIGPLGEQSMFKHEVQGKSKRVPRT